MAASSRRGGSGKAWPRLRRDGFRARRQDGDGSRPAHTATENAVALRVTTMPSRARFSGYRCIDASLHRSVDSPRQPEAPDAQAQGPARGSSCAAPTRRRCSTRRARSSASTRRASTSTSASRTSTPSSPRCPATTRRRPATCCSPTSTASWPAAARCAPLRRRRLRQRLRDEAALRAAGLPRLRPRPHPRRRRCSTKRAAPAIRRCCSTRSTTWRPRASSTRSLGFVEIPPYYYNPIPGAHYLKAELD